MNEEKIKLKVITHEKILLEREVDEIYSMSTDGSFGVLKNHIPFVTSLDIGVTKFVTDSKCEYITTMGGVFEFKDNVATILTDVAEIAGDIDIMRAKSAKERAEARLNSKSKDIEIARAELALAKSLARINAKEKA